MGEGPVDRPSRWVPLDPEVAQGEQRGHADERGRRLDRRHRQGRGKGDYTIVAETDLAGITGIRLEALADDRLPQKGPGRATDGNFVLNEFEVTAAPKADPKQAKPVVLQNALADFTQAGFDVSSDRRQLRNGGKGWAVSPVTGLTHWATFEAKEPVGATAGPC